MTETNMNEQTMAAAAACEVADTHESVDASMEACDDANGEPGEDVNADVGTDAEANTESGEKGTITEQALAAAVAEAEQRGYLRGRNESIEALMERPAEEERVEILQHRRMSIWDL